VKGERQAILALAAKQQQGHVAGAAGAGSIAVLVILGGEYGAVIIVLFGPDRLVADRADGIVAHPPGPLAVEAGEVEV